jgi:pimeloyl-ACP methyl ester carboxylesterase
MTVLMITIDGGTLSYNVSGAGPPIVFVAGLGDRGTYWTAQVAAFSSAFQVVTFDHRGVGASEGRPPYKSRAMGRPPCDALKAPSQAAARNCGAVATL